MVQCDSVNFFLNVTKNELKETDKDELKRTTPFYPRTFNMPKKFKILLSQHKTNSVKLKTGGDIQRCFNDDMNSVLIRDFKMFLIYNGYMGLDERWTNMESKLDEPKEY